MKKITIDELYSYIIKKDYVSMSELKKKFPNSNLKYYLKKLQKLGLRRIRRGTYSFSKVEEEFIPLIEINKNIILGFHTALELHGLAQTEMFYTKYFINKKKYKSFEKGNYFYQSIKQKVIHYKEKKHYGNKFKVTILEQTLIDCINKPLYCGGFEELFRSLSSLKLNKKNYEKLIELLKEYNYKNLYNKVGFTFDELNKAFRLNTPSWFFDEIKKNMNVKNYQLLEKTWEKGNLVKNKIWKIKYNKNLYSTLKGFY